MAVPVNWRRLRSMRHRSLVICGVASECDTSWSICCEIFARVSSIFAFPICIDILDELELELFCDVLAILLCPGEPAPGCDGSLNAFDLEMSPNAGILPPSFSKWTFNAFETSLGTEPRSLTSKLRSMVYSLSLRTSTF